MFTPEQTAHMLLNFKKEVEKTVTDLEKCLKIEEGAEVKKLRLMVKPCDDRPDEYDLFTIQNIDYNKIMGQKSNYRLYLDKYFILNGKNVKGVSLVATFWLIQFPGCCGIALSTQAMTLPEYKQRGIGTVLNKLRIEIARVNGYAVLTCTAVNDGITERILKKNGWKEDFSFVNKRTNNPVTMYHVNLWRQA